MLYYRNKKTYKTTIKTYKTTMKTYKKTMKTYKTTMNKVNQIENYKTKRTPSPVQAIKCIHLMNTLNPRRMMDALYPWTLMK